MDVSALDALNQRLSACRTCARLVAWREEVAHVKVRRYRDENYWGRPVPGFGDRSAQVLVVGLAPAAHGANRTGRMFTGDSSGDWLIEALYQNGFANQPTSSAADDGLVLINAYMTAAVRCAPPDNRPTPSETRACAPYLDEELAILAPRVIIALGRVAYDAVRRALKQRGVDTAGWEFAHGATWRTEGLTCMASYHPSRQNTQTGKLTRDMLGQVFAAAQDALTV